MQRKKGSKRIQMIIKMANEFKLTVFASPTRCKSLHACGFTAGQQNCVGSGPPGFWAAGPSRAVGPWAAGPLGRWAVAGRGPLGRSGPWAAGRWAFGPSGLRATGPWRAAGLLLAKPQNMGRLISVKKLFCSSVCS